MKKTILLLAIILTVFVQSVSASLVLDNIQFDPAIIAAGDEVDIVIQFQDKSITEDESRIGNPDYTFKITLEADDTLTKEYITLVDSEGDDLHGSIYSGDKYNKLFRVKVNQNAPAGNYEFKLKGQWYYKGTLEDDAYNYVRFKMPVKKEGIILDISTLETVPLEVRPGDDFVKVTARLENVGEKDAKSIEINLNLPNGLSSSYSDNNRLWIGRLNSGESKELTFFIDVNEDTVPGVYNVGYNLEYLDSDNNNYEKERSLPFLIKSRPYLEVINVSGRGLTGKTEKLYVTVKNTGLESAEAVDVRIIKQNSQPFVIDVRSDYIGELEPGEEGLAIFDISVNKDAEIKRHDFKLLIRSKGDSDKGDDNIYTYDRRASFDVTGNSKSIYTLIGVILTIAVLSVFIYHRYAKKR